MPKKIENKIGEIIDEIYDVGRRDKVYGRLDKVNQISNLLTQARKEERERFIKVLEEELKKRQFQSPYTEGINYVLGVISRLQQEINKLKKE